MNTYLKFPLYIIALTLVACATSPSNAQLRETHFKYETEREARLQKTLGTREQAICSSDNNDLGRAAQLVVRIPPIMPAAAITSGSCKMKFDVNPIGQVVNIQTLSCTDDIFNMSSRRSLSRWKYNPKFMNGKTVAQCGIENTISYVLVDNKGNKIEPRIP